MCQACSGAGGGGTGMNNKDPFVTSWVPWSEAHGAGGWITDSKHAKTNSQHAHFKQ